jgi:lactate dehydrogenase-like 2-hydroxyacid dehydrogenase
MVGKRRGTPGSYPPLQLPVGARGLRTGKERRRGDAKGASRGSGERRLAYGQTETERKRLSMRFGVIGLGRMGANIARHAMEKGHAVVGFDTTEETRRQLSAAGLEPAGSLAELVDKLKAPRIVMLYVPHGRSPRRCATSCAPG